MPAAVGPALWVSFVKLVATSAINYVINKAMQKRPTRQLQRVDVEYVGSLEPRRKLYGNFRASGLNTIPALTSGIDITTQAAGVWLHKLLTISDGQIQSVDAVYFNQNQILASQWTAANGRISGGPYSGYASVIPHLGLASQPADANITQVPGWTNAHRGDGVAYVYFNFYANNSVYPGGPPDPVMVEGRGAIVYDPRLDVSPGASPTNASYIAFTTNPALITADYLTWGAGENAANINWSDVVSVANTCDENCNIPDGLGGTTTQKRFTCSVEVYAPLSLSDRDATIQMLARSFMGAIWWSGNKWRMRAGIYSSPAFTLIDTDFLGDVMEIDTAQPRSGGGVFNTVRGSYVDQGENTQPKPMPEVSTAAYVSADGEVIYTDVEFKTARTVYEAERNAILLNRQGRRRIIIGSVFRFKAWKLQLYDTVTVTCAKVAWSSQVARIIGLTLTPKFEVQLRLQEIASSDFTDPLVSDYLQPNSVALPVGTTYLPGTPTNLTAQALASAISFTWTPPTSAPVGVLYRLYEYSSSTPFSSAVQVGPDTPQTSLIIPRTSTTTAYFWIVAVDPVTLAVSSNYPTTNGVPAAAASASSTLGALVTPGSATISGYTSSLTTPTVTVTPTGGTPGYTYATTAISGGAGITTNNGTTASPSWSATGLAEGDVKSGSYRIRVTDSVAATADVFVAVTISRLFGVTLVDTTINATGTANTGFGGGTPAIAYYTVSSDGNVYPSPGTTYQWKNPGASASSYDIRFTLNSGTIGSGTTGSWLNLGSGAQVIVKTRSPGAGAGTDTANLTVEIRDSGTLVVLATKTLIENCTLT
jgi:hypothetical protein